MERQFKTQIDIMQNAMKEQLSVSKEAVSTINALRHELAATQAESCRLHSEMHDSKGFLLLRLVHLPNQLVLLSS